MSKIKLGIIVQARNSSTRFPRKLLKKFHQENSLIDIVLNLLKTNFSNLEIVLATSNLECDNIFKSYCEKYDIKFFKGSHENVLKRFVDASSKHLFTHVVRICSDNPFLISTNINQIIELLYSNKEKDYISFKMSNELPVIKSHLGLFGEIVSVSSLNKVLELTYKKKYLENVTEFIYENPAIFDILLVDAPKEVLNRYDLRFTLDDENDFFFLKEFYSNLHPKVDDLKEIVEKIKEKNDFKNHMISNIDKYSK